MGLVRWPASGLLSVCRFRSPLAPTSYNGVIPAPNGVVIRQGLALFSQGNYQETAEI